MLLLPGAKKAADKLNSKFFAFSIELAPVIDKDLTCHKFAIFIPENDAGFSTERVEKLLRDLGADEVKKVAEY